MKFLVKVLVISILCSSCGASDGRYIDPMLEPYVLEFEEYMGITVRSDVEFATADVLGGADYVGLCKKKVGQNRVYISDTVKIHANSEYIMSIIYHELGHCELKLEHENAHHFDDFGKSYPLTFMTETIYAPQVYSILGFDFYKSELKERAGL